MTTNAQDEKWSEWIDWNGGECPLPDGTSVHVKFRGSMDLHSDHPQWLSWWNFYGDRDIIAYRYKIKEPESDMHPDLEWLARNVGEWDENYTHIGVLEDIQDGSKSQEVFANPDLLQNPITQAGKIVPLFTKAQWLQARKDLGLIMSDEEEEMPAEEYKSAEVCNYPACTCPIDKTTICAMGLPEPSVKPWAPKQLRYQDAKGEDWIDEFARTSTIDEFRGAMRFTIGKYNRRAGKKDDLVKEIEKMRDYCERWLSYEKERL